MRIWGWRKENHRAFLKSENFKIICHNKQKREIIIILPRVEKANTAKYQKLFDVLLNCTTKRGERTKSGLVSAFVPVYNFTGGVQRIFITPCVIGCDQLVSLKAFDLTWLVPFFFSHTLWIQTPFLPLFAPLLLRPLISTWKLEIEIKSKKR